jgi:hypothetical protein
MRSFVSSSDLETSSKKAARLNTIVGRPRGSLQLGGSILNTSKPAGKLMEDMYRERVVIRHTSVLRRAWRAKEVVYL